MEMCLQIVPLAAAIMEDQLWVSCCEPQKDDGHMGKQMTKRLSHAVFALDGISQIGDHSLLLYAMHFRGVLKYNACGTSFVNGQI